MSINIVLTSIHGKRLGLSSSGGLLYTTTATGVQHAAEISSAGVMNSSISSFLSTLTEMTIDKLKSVLETITASESTLKNSGISVLSSGTETARNFTIAAPEIGIKKTIHSISSATTILIETTDATIKFITTAGQSSLLTYAAIGGAVGQSVVMEGLSATRWGVLSKTAGVS